jgi:hypothetical protein
MIDADVCVACIVVPILPVAANFIPRPLVLPDNLTFVNVAIL